MAVPKNKKTPFRKSNKNLSQQISLKRLKKSTFNTIVANSQIFDSITYSSSVNLISKSTK